MAKTPPNDPKSSQSAPGERVRPGEFIERDLWQLDEDLDAPPPSGASDEEPETNPSSPTHSPTPESKAPAHLPTLPRNSPDSRSRSTAPTADPVDPSDEESDAAWPARSLPAPAKKKGQEKAPLAGMPTKDQRTQAGLSNRRKSHPLDATFADLEDRPARVPSPAQSEWSDLDSPPPEPPVDATPTTPPAESATVTAPSTEVAPEAPQAADSPPMGDATDSPAASAASPKSATRLSRAEVVALCAVAVVLVATAITTLVYFRRDIPTNSSAIAQIDFPVKGQQVAVADASTYWRAPRREGPSPDAARAETRLIPVLRMRIEGNGTGALRIFFRNELGDPVGDSITRPFANGVFTESNSPEIEIPATAGFDDEGMYAAYRASQTHTTPWRVHIHEGPSAAASFQQFTKILEVPISTNRN